MRNLLLGLAAFALAGCATTLKFEPVKPEVEKSASRFPYGVVTEKSVGDQMMEYNLYFHTSHYQGFVAEEDFQPPHPSTQVFPLIKAGSEWVAVGKTEDGSLLCKNTEETMRIQNINPINGRPINSSFEYQACLLVNSLGEPFGGAYCRLYDRTYEKEVTAYIWENRPKNFLKPVKISKDRVLKRKKAYITYAGKTGGTIRLLYKETEMNDTELTFDLSEDRIIAVKDITFEIFEATNMSIKYRVITTPDELKMRLEERKKQEKEKREAFRPVPP